MRRTKWSPWELASRAPSLEHAESEAKLLISTATKKQFKIVREGREFSIYIRKQQIYFPGMGLRKGRYW